MGAEESGAAGYQNPLADAAFHVVSNVSMPRLPDSQHPSYYPGAGLPFRNDP